MNCYVPTKPKSSRWYDLHERLQEMTFNEIVEDPKRHFDNVYVTNFDLIHHKSRGDVLSFSEKFYKTITTSKLKQIDYPKLDRFVAAAIRSKRDDVYLEKDVIKRHFKKDVELELLQRGIFLSNMKRMAYIKKGENRN